ncbi:NUDIX hydrolase [Bosea sp. 117]|uniref:NUDIX hydrolase n=1 Tax=Bosea sp. 117 TaxID=1125973 RepID=UPI000AE41DB2|nr:NUDIX hydrolase [Bosea sp. 117]
MAKSKLKKKKRNSGQTLRQVAALPFRDAAEGGIEFLVLSSRETRRFIVPKGWPIKGRKDWKAAQIEARQEAGVVGEIGRKRIGEYRYWKRLDTHFTLIKVSVYPLKVTRQLDDWPERHERDQRWLSPQDAALLIDESDLADLMLDFARTDAVGKPGKSAKGEDAAPREAEPQG